ncbi:putative RNA polymerase II nuclear localization protein SLC7A6OS [Rhinoderma darwinii]|uniref:putative RNA polymerase II nuclear localization protein SLC7A6OS n=1 Tax=Rhinoderma darwinii TaxID=43563 RepID=UPI003F679A5D
MEAAVLRVKRKRGADPVEALIISCKRPRPEEETPESAVITTQVFKLAATVTSQDDPVQKYVQDAISRDRATQVNRPPIGSLQRIQRDLRAFRDAERQESRYRLVSSLRPKCEEEEDSKSANSQPSSSLEEPQHVPKEEEASAQEEKVSKGAKEEAIQLFDIVQEETEKAAADPQACDPETIMCNSVKMIRERLTVSQEGQGAEHRENSDEFVYDIYYAESSPHNWIQDILSVKPYVYEQELTAADDEPDEVYEDEDDENEEGNWRNDYPDEEERSDQERYMGYYEHSDDESGHGRGHTWDVYCQKAIRECESGEEEYSD